MDQPIVVCDKATIQWYGKSQDVGVMRVHLLPYASPAKYSFCCTVVDIGDLKLKVLGAERAPKRHEVSQMKGVVRRAGFHTVLWERAPEDGQGEIEYVEIKI